VYERTIFISFSYLCDNYYYSACSRWNWKSV